MKKMLFSFFAFFVPLAFASIEVQNFDSPKQEAEYRSLIAELRCPQCQNNNIADSNATIATDMRHKTLELLKQGKSKQQVVDYMVERYGNFVTYDPPITPATVLLWLLPLLLLAIGCYIIVKRRDKTAEQAVDLSPHLASNEQDRLKHILEKDEL